MIIQNYSRLTVAVLLTCVGTTSLAQTLEEIVVTAQKREESIQQVPMTIQAFSGDALFDARITTTQDLKFLVPSLQYSNNAAYATPFLRGIGTDLTQPNSDPSVATYIDNAFVASNLGTIMNLLGVERVEVLKGPQGTLFGRNAVGGAISVITLTPTAKTDVAMSAGVGNFSSRELSGHLSGALTDKLFGGIYLAGSQSDSYYTNVGPAVKEQAGGLNDNSQWGIRAKLVYQPVDWVNLTLSAEHTQADLIDIDQWRQIQDNALGYVFGVPVVNQRYVISESFGNQYRVKQDSATVKEEFDLSRAKIVGITNYRKTRSRLFFDFDATAAPLVALSVDVQGARQFSQELQVLSLDDSKWKWVGGIFFYKENAFFDPTSIHAPILFPSVGLPPISSVFSAAKTTSIAGFGQATAPLTDRLNLTVGGRYTHEKKEANARTELVNTLHGPPVVLINFPNSEKTWSEFTPRVGLDYTIGGTLLYATYSKGFKSGVYNLAAPGDIGPVNPEKLTSYEIGSKSDFNDGRMRFNTSAYFYDFTDIQVQVNQQSSGSSAVLRNAASAQAYGIETEFSALIGDNFTLRAAVDWEHGRYQKFLGYATFDPAPAGNAPTSIDASGNQMQRAPEWVGTLGAEYRLRLASGAATKFKVGWFYNGKFFWDASNKNVVNEPAYNTVDASVSYISSGGDWEIALWGKNLSDTYYHNGVIYNQFGTDANDAAPRTYGLTATFRYGK